MNISTSKPQKSEARQNTDRTARLLERMKKGDDAFNARDYFILSRAARAEKTAFQW